MLVKCIPILEYGRHFRPSLQHDINCVNFSGLSDMQSQIFYCLNMSIDDLQRLSGGVHEYVKQHIEPVVTVERLRRMSGNVINLFFNAEELSIIKLTPYG